MSNKNIFNIAKNIQEQNNDRHRIDKEQHQDLQYDEKYQKQAEQALKMINAYRKVQNIPVKTNNIVFNNINTNNKNEQKQKEKQPKSSYANKIKQTLRQLNANKIKQYQKIKQNNQIDKNQKNAQSLQINNQKNKKSLQEQKLLQKATQKITYQINQVMKRKFNEIINSIKTFYELKLQEDYKMARKYRLFRLFTEWKQKSKQIKSENQKRRKEELKRQNQGMDMAKQFYSFIIIKKAVKSWKKFTKEERKSRKYQNELRKIEIEQQLNKKVGLEQIKQDAGEITERTEKSQKTLKTQRIQQNSNLQNKLRGFLDGLKHKIDNKSSNNQNNQRLKTIKEKTQQSKNVENSYEQSMRGQNSTQMGNQYNSQNQSDAQRQISNQDHLDHQQNQQQLHSKKVLTNEQLQKRRKQLSDRANQRKRALDKLKKQKQQKKLKQQGQKRELQKFIQQEQKRKKQEQYLQYQKIKKLEKEWEEKEVKLMKKADEFNKLRRMGWYGMQPWKRLKKSNEQSAIKIKEVVERVMIKHAGEELMENLKQNLQMKLERLYEKMQLIHDRNLKRKTILSFKLELNDVKEQKVELQSFHEVHTQKIIFSSWVSILDALRLENMQYERPLIKRATQYHKLCILLKSLKCLKEHTKQVKKQKNILSQKQKIKSKIKNIINQKIQINYEDFL